MSRSLAEVGLIRTIKVNSGGSGLQHLVLLQGDLSPLEAQHEFGPLRLDVNVLRGLFDLLRQVPAATADGNQRGGFHRVWTL